MNMTLNNDWYTANYQYLLKVIFLVHKTLENAIESQEHQPLKDISPSINFGMSAPSALEQLCTIFQLTEFERNVLLLCAAMEIDYSFGSLCGQVLGDMQVAYPSISLAMKVLPATDWSAWTVDAPLRHWQLIQIQGGITHTQNPLRIDERIFHYLLGLQSQDERLKGIISPINPVDFLVPSHEKIAQKVAAIWTEGKKGKHFPIVQLYGDDFSSMQAISAAASSMLGLQVFAISPIHLPQDIHELNNILLLWEREAILTNSVLLIDSEGDELEKAQQNVIFKIIDKINSLLIIISRERIGQRQRPLICLEVHRPTRNEQSALWESSLGELANHNKDINNLLVSQFNLNAPTIDAVCTEVRGKLVEARGEIGDIQNLLWDTCRAQARLGLDDLAQQIPAKATWDDLVFTKTQKQILQSIAGHLRQRIQVYEKWGFASASRRGLGISALFAGASGTGKTTSAEVLANELRLDLYRIDLSAVASKYIGETEKNLRRIFDAADAGAAILLFDEADALFGKRSEVKDARDRYANMEVSYLLQRMEEYQGLAILTTNLKDAIDPAFMRRIRFFVKFDFPDAKQREEIWQQIFPKNTPTKDLNYTHLGRLNLAGGNIRNIALNAAFIAADSGESVMMKHIKQSAQIEYMKLGMMLTDVETRGWV
ncbi:ATP-binding protein [Nodularia sp. UHCC 0506]|uniref:ATP-binding protein n=1 Tax=Nodularia sp. UHCC 0506 TaxID=3110243 RepID=UPI002B20586F|nr:ATP-binding protein [Nodularia sp. UHCC 0506]MEA5515874.1 ATP-binding protein [Nodularia sp. UHCC 0506]